MNSDGERGYNISRHSHSNHNLKLNNGNNDMSNSISNDSISNQYHNGGNDYEKYDNKLQQQQQSQQQQQQQQQQERYLWEIRKRSPNTTPASTVLNSPDLTDMQYSQNSHLHYHHHHHPQHQIHVGRSPVSQNDDDYDDNQLLSVATSPGSPTDIGKVSAIGLVREGEIVVFDDIDTNWRKTTTTPSSLISHHNECNYYRNLQEQKQQQQQQKQQHQYQYNQYHNTQNNISDDVLKVTKMIGQLPIAEYEGSPRRIGNHQQQQQYELSSPSGTAQNNKNVNNFITKNLNTTSSSSVFPPRPGFPQRISPSTTATATVITASLASIADNNYQSINTTETNSLNVKQDLIDITKDINVMNSINTNDDNNKPKTPTFDYLYEFSETRKVLEEFFKGPNDEDKKFNDLNESDDLGSCDTHQECKYNEDNKLERSYIGQRLARIPNDEFLIHKSRLKQQICDDCDGHNDIELYIDSNSRSSGELGDTELIGDVVGEGERDEGRYDGSVNMIRRHSRNFTLSPETTDYDSNCGDLDSLSNDINCQTDFGRLYTSMPVLEDGLSSGHASDTENNFSTVMMIERNYLDMTPMENDNTTLAENNDCINKDNIMVTDPVNATTTITTPTLISSSTIIGNSINNIDSMMIMTNSNNSKNLKENNYDSIYSMNISQCTPPPPAPAPHRLPPPPPPPPPPTTSSAPPLSIVSTDLLSSTVAGIVTETQDIQEALKDIRSTLQRTKTIAHEKVKATCDEVIQGGRESPIWIPRGTLSNDSVTDPIKQQCESQDEQEHDEEEEEEDQQQEKQQSQQQGEEQQCHDDDEADTDLETDRLLGQQRLDDQGFYDDKNWSTKESKMKSPLNTSSSGNVLLSSIPGSNASSTSITINSTVASSTTTTAKPQTTFSSATIRQGIGTSLTPTSPEHCQIIGSIDVSLTSPENLQFKKSPTGSIKSKKDSSNNSGCNSTDKKSVARNKEGRLLDPSVLIEGVLFRARYLGSTQLVCEGQPTKSTRMMQAEEAVSRIKAPEGESQPSTEVDLFISTEKIMVLNTDLKEIMMDHALRTISYIADIGDLVVLMARRRFVPSDNEEGVKPNRTPKMICHVFESDEAQFIAQSIGQAFQVAYMEFLKANGIEDHSFVKEMDYQEVLNSQEIFGDELEIFAKKELQKEVVVPKAKGEILGVVIVESGWGSMLPTVVIANLMSSGAAARCGQLNIGDQLIAINGMSLVGLPLSTCQSYIRNTKNQTAVKFTVVPCPPVVEVKIKRPNTKYQLGFSVQNGVICSLLRGGIAERGGVRVGHRIIEINNQSVVAVPHEKIVNLLATSVGEILMKTMPTSMFRLLTGQENPVYI